MEFIDLKTQQQKIIQNITQRIKVVLDHGQYIMGPEVKELEEKLAKFVGVKYGIACSSGTDALLLSLLAYKIGRGDAIFTTPFTFIAAAEVISLIGAVPIFVDIDSNSYNIDPEKLDSTITSFKKGNIHIGQIPIIPKGIIAVDLFGLPADYDRINEIGNKHGLFVIEDAAQSFGSEYKGKKAGGLADIGCTSFFPAKPLGCYGDGGMCFTNNEELAEVIRSLSIHGQGKHKYDHARVGINGRLDTLQAAILLEKFAIFPEEITLRQQVADRYKTLLNSCDSIKIASIPQESKSIWAQYSILARDENHRSELQKRLMESGIPTAIHYPKPLHLQPAFAGLKHSEGDFPISENYSKRIFSIPMHPYLKQEDQECIANVILKV